MSHESNPSGRQRLHPLVATAAVSLTVFALAGAAAVTGLVGSPFARDPHASTIVDPMKEGAPVKDGATVKDGVRQSVPATATATRDDGNPRATRPAPAVRQQAPRNTAPATAAATPHDTAVTAPAIDPNQATVLAVDRVEQAGEGSGLGVIGGGIVGGALGNQVGGGNGRKAMTVLGAVGGAVAGNAIEKQVRSTVHYAVQVRMADGSVRSLRYDQAPPFQPGDRIRVDAHAS